MRAFSSGRVPVVCWSCVGRVLVVCPDDYFQQSYTRAYTRTRTGIFRLVIFRRQFLDIIVIFRRIGIFSFFLPIVIFRYTRNFQTAKA